MKRTFKKPIRFASSYLDWGNLDHAESTFEEYEGELWEDEFGEEYVWIEREELDELLDSNGVELTETVEVEVDVGNVDNINLNVGENDD